MQQVAHAALESSGSASSPPILLFACVTHCIQLVNLETFYLHILYYSTILLLLLL